MITDTTERQNMALGVGCKWVIQVVALQYGK